ncbi:hypothetical protein FOMPIDRAFT_1022008 [Fomitopsis schrenkii]|uniref:Uncharacterized protein n=1 Tax=Fomitopsis schrenkii TaxID=2126942 RepID=S8EJH2_FOMSC|nr:hypothetical protein FOMPIDRAFT_1022008 [Fomitopsis schrenkii]
MRVTWLSLFSLATLLAGLASAAPVVVSPQLEGVEAREALDARQGEWGGSSSW